MQVGLDPHIAVGRPIPCLTAAYTALSFRDLELAHRVEAAIGDRRVDGWHAQAQPFARAAVAFLEGDHERARSEFVAIDLLLPDHWAYCTLRAADIDLHLGDHASARSRLAAVVEATDKSSLGEADALADTVESLLAIDAGDPESAVVRALAALSRTIELDYRTAIASSLGALAVAVDELRPADPAAAQMLGAADAFAQSTGSAWHGVALDAALNAMRDRVEPEPYEAGKQLPLLDAATEALAHFPSEDRPSTGWDSLTPAEERVVALVGEGLSNPEIAENLYVSVSTVKTHLVHAYQKLQIDSRSALAAAAATRAAHE